MRHQLFAGAALVALSVSSAAYAQSTGSIDVEEEIVVTASRSENGVEGVVVPDTAKAKAVITQELISRGSAGNTILNTINLVPGVNFTQSDAYGSSGGNIRIRGFDGNRISLTFDGFPLNDSGNYAIFSNQQLDPELIEQVNVNLGTTDVDSPTASAAGGTVNYRTITGGDNLGGEISGSVGEDDYSRIFGRFNTGVFTSFGTKAWFSASTARNDKFKGPGKIYKQQYNARVYQPLGDNGDFLSLAVHYNQNRNNFYRNPSVSDMRGIFTNAVIPDAGNISPSNPLNLGIFSGAQQDTLSAFENLATCTKTVGGAGTQNDNGGRLPSGGTGANNAPPVNGSNNNNILNTSSCTNFYGVRINPSNTGNARFNSRFTLAENLTFTADASWQYVLANGGGWTTLAENSAIAKGSNPASPGSDFNKDGDFSDTIGFYTPNNTNTRRYTAIMSLIWDINDNHRVRLAYTYDRARHRQTGEWGYLDDAGNPLSPFGGRNSGGVFAADGFQLQQRDRLSIALLNQVAGQYIGKFFDEKLRVELGLRAPFFKRDLTNYCYTQTGGSGFATCTSQPVGTTPVPSTNGQIYIVPNNFTGPFPNPNNTVWAPFSNTYKFDKLLPNAGLTFKITPAMSLFASYAKGFSAPRTDNLYRAPVVTITPETTDAFDLGVRYTTSKVQAQLTGWYIGYQNRIVTSFDQQAGISVDRNVGKVKTYGFDAGVGFKPIEQLFLYTFASYNHSKLQDDIQIGTTSTAPGGGPNIPIFAPTSGKFVTETPKWTFGGRASVELGPVEIGGQVKYVDKRFATDVNDVVVPSYTLVDLDARLNLKQWGLDKTYFQLNVSNLFDKYYFGNISTQINAGNICPAGGYTCAVNNANPNFSIGAPRTVLGTLHIGF